MVDETPEEDGYRVGYGKPPKEHQFPPGRSGNPKGRKKGARGLKTDLQAELDGTIAITINGQRVHGTRQRLFVKALATRAAFGDLKAASILAPLILQVLGIEDRGGDRQALSASDQAILDDLLSGGNEAPAGPHSPSVDSAREPVDHSSDADQPETPTGDGDGDDS